MWLAWPERVDIYISRTAVMLKVGQQAPAVMEYPETFPLSRVLSALQEALHPTEQGSARRTPRRRFHIALSAALCPGYNHALPAGLVQWQEQEAFIRAACAQAMSLAPEQVMVARDASSPGIAAALPVSFVEQVSAWALAQHGTVVSMAPMWSLLTQCKASRNKAVRKISVREPDGAFALELGWQASSTTFIANPSDLAVMQAANAQAGSDEPTAQLKLAFDLKAQALPAHSSQAQHRARAGLPRGPWQAHWSLA